MQKIHDYFNNPLPDVWWYTGCNTNKITNNRFAQSWAFRCWAQSSKRHTSLHFVFIPRQTQQLWLDFLKSLDLISGVNAMFVELVRKAGIDLVFRGKTSRMWMVFFSCTNEKKTKFCYCWGSITNHIKILYLFFFCFRSDWILRDDSWISDTV